MEQEFYDDLCAMILDRNDMPAILNGVKIPEGVAVSSRDSAEFTYIFIQNFNMDGVEMELPADSEQIFGDVHQTIPGLGTVVLRRKKEEEKKYR